MLEDPEPSARPGRPPPSLCLPPRSRALALPSTVGLGAALVAALILVTAFGVAPLVVGAGLLALLVVD
ncbi:hypothetical protein G6O69_16410 [Pseudenhygromyxa sp. WMMC2535]|uniref:hypothetical protein n=1 Tax=Pseudenhygromyxa sp. WMMC2535 TaxID=2712867 RepID=UPI001555CF4B|nr:hypothetical protein [Pseudenhygromyxa sp. WMMC2535]NVB39426.1 hypothetical protein [Pseudenhygromyxa sp. WMMC2535]